MPAPTRHLAPHAELVRRTHRTKALGATVEVTCVLHEDADPSWLDEPLELASERLRAADRTFRGRRRASRRPDGRPVLPDDVQDVLLGCARARSETGGWFDPWRLPGGLDPSGYVRGWAAERALRALTSVPLVGATVKVGHTLATLGTPDGQGPFRVEAAGRQVLVDGSIASTSQDPRRGHLVNPWTGERATAVALAVVTGPDAGMADALAVALCVGGEEVRVRLETLPGYEGLAVGHDGSTRLTAGFPLAAA